MSSLSFFKQRINFTTLINIANIDTIKKNNWYVVPVIAVIASAKNRINCQFVDFAIWIASSLCDTFAISFLN